MMDEKTIQPMPRPANIVYAGCSFVHGGPFHGCERGPRLAQHLAGLGTIQNSAVYTFLGHPGCDHQVLIDETKAMFDRRDAAGNTQQLDLYVFSGWSATEAVDGWIAPEDSEVMRLTQELIDLVRERTRTPDQPEGAMIVHVSKASPEPVTRTDAKWFFDDLGLTEVNWYNWNQSYDSWLMEQGVRCIKYAQLIWRASEVPREEIDGVADYHTDPYSSYLAALHIHWLLLLLHISRNCPDYVEPSKAYCDSLLCQKELKLRIEPCP